MADAFDAMTANRIYRNQMDIGYVMNELKKGRGTQFDPDVVDIFLRILDEGTIDLNRLYPKQMQHSEQEEAAKKSGSRKEEEKKAEIIKAEGSQKTAGKE